MIRRFAVVVVGLALAIAVPVPPSATAQSETSQYGTLSANDPTVTGTTCANVVIQFAPASTIQDWQMEVMVDDSNGNWLPEFNLTPATPTHTLNLCPGRNRTGYYGISGTLEANSTSVPPGSGCCSISAGYNTDFNFRDINRIPTALGVKVVRSHSTRCPLGRTRHCSLVTGALTRGGKPYGDWFELQEVEHGRWTRLTWCRAGGGGHCGWYVVIGKREIHSRFRLYYPIQDYAKASSSRVFHLFY